MRTPFPLLHSSPTAPRHHGHLHKRTGMPGCCNVHLHIHLLIDSDSVHVPGCSMLHRYEWASGIITMYVVGFLGPVLLQTTALTAAGFPGVCPNVANVTAPDFAGFPATCKDSPDMNDSNGLQWFHYRTDVGSCATSAAAERCFHWPGRDDSGN